MIHRQFIENARVKQLVIDFAKSLNTAGWCDEMKMI